MAINPSGLIVSGFSMGAGTNYDFATIEYSLITGVEPISGKIPQYFILYQNYPNPFNPATVIKFDNPSASLVNLVIYDILGKEIEILVNEELPAGSYEFSWNASSYSSGIYFYRIYMQDLNGYGRNYSQVKKMILTK
jgi:hypothetical protein